MTRRILLTGGTGFLGRPVLDRLRAPGSPVVRLLWHERKPGAYRSSSVEANRIEAGRVDSNGVESGGVALGGVESGGVELVRGDLGCPETLRGVCDGIETVIHLATYIGDNEELCDVVNGRGTEALVEKARAAGVRRILYVSSAAIYGWAVHRGAKMTEVAVRPATPISRSRARAERAVLTENGVVLRPLFVYGQGDTRFVPALLRFFERYPFLIDGGQARISVIAVEDLADVIAAFATGAWSQDQPEVFHIDDGHPPSIREIAEALSRSVGSRVPVHSVPFFVARAVLGMSGRGIFGGASRRSVAHRVFLASRDHYYDSSPLWSSAGLRPGPPLVERLPRYADWYSRFVKGGGSDGSP